MPQRHMPLPLFRDILSRLPPGQHTVSLQGEGEPLTHPEFWEMVKLVEQRGCIPYTITNGSKIDPERMGLYFPWIGVSLDTLDADEAQRIGRYAHLVGRERVIGGVDCGFSIHVGSGGLDPEVVWAKLAALAEGAAIASRSFWR
mgnify:CR=1 FL=1